MKIKCFATASPLFPSVTFREEQPICFFATPSIFLHVMRCLLDGSDSDFPIDESKMVACVNQVTLDLDGAEYELCSILFDNGDFYVAARDGQRFSKKKTRECLTALRAWISDEKSMYCSETHYYTDAYPLSACDYSLANFRCFLDAVRSETEKGDRRPIFIFNFFDRLDEAVDITPFLDELATLGRQVFVAVGSNYPDEKMRHDKVQVVKLLETEED